MITLHSKLDIASSFPLQFPYTWEDIIFFDIETTGFSASTSYLYLIGCMYYKENTWQMIQWLADDMNSEEEILDSFFNTLKSYKRLVHFNGTGFDIPYILHKCKRHHLQDPFQTIESFDIYKKLLPHKKLLPLSNYKLKTIELFLGLEREDSYSGEELIQIYANYLGRIQYERLHLCQSNNNIPLSDSPSSVELSHIFLLHNMEDVIGLLQVADILYYTTLFEKDIDILAADSSQDENRLILKFILPYSLPHAISWKAPLKSYHNVSDTSNLHLQLSANADCDDMSLQLSAVNNELILIIPIYHGELKYFYDEYKNYYYLPKEDMAIHKSVAQYVDKDFRMKAKASNCYTRKSSSFLPQQEELISPSFKAEYTDKSSYFESSNPLFMQTPMLNNYAKSLIRYIERNKETEISYNL